MSHGMSIIVRSPNWIGDQILALPFYYHLRKTYPEARITCLCVPWVKDIQFLDLIDEVILVEKTLSDRLSDRYESLKETSDRIISKGPFEIGFSLPNSFSAALTFYFGKVKNRIGYNTDLRRFLLTRPLPWNSDPKIHRSQSYLNILGELPRGAGPSTKFFGNRESNVLDETIITGGELDKFDPIQSWRPISKVEPPEFPYYLICPGASAESRRWPIEYYLELIRRIHEEWGWQALVVGGAKEAPLGDLLHQAVPNKAHDWTARGPVSHLYALFQNAKFSVTNESGLAHYSALMGCPTYVLGGAAIPSRTEPIGPGRVRLFVNPIKCWPCEKNICQLQNEDKLLCLKGVAPTKVFQGIKRDFENHGRSDSN